MPWSKLGDWLAPSLPSGGGALPRGPGRLAEAVAWAAGVAAVLALAHRFRYVVDLTDEAFSIAMPYRVALGDRPFVDEISIQQTAGMLLLPFVWVYTKLTGGTAGIVLFCRGIHLLYKALAGLAVYAAARRLLRHRASAVAVGFVPFAFVHFGIPNVGYNLLGTVLTTAATFLSAAGVAGAAPNRRALFLSGLAYALAAFAYPPMIVGPALGLVVLLLCAPSQRLAALGAFVLGGAVGVLLVAPTFAFGGAAGVRRSLAFGIHDPKPAWPRMKAVLEATWAGVPWIYKWAAGALVLARLLRARIATAVLVPPIALALLLWFKEQLGTWQGTQLTVIYLALFAPALLLVAQPDARVWRAALVVLAPSLACGVACGAFSTNGPLSACLGLHAAMVLFVLLATRALEQARAERTYALFPALAALYVLVSATFDYVYRDAPIAQLDTRVTSGPFRGLHTTADRAQMVAELEQLMRRLDRPGGHATMLYDRPGMYLFTRMPPAARCVWEVPWGEQQGLVDYWRSRANGLGVVVYAKGSGRGPAFDPIAAVADRKVAETPRFVAYAEK